MRYVILRDDDTSALTPPACLERLYRPFLQRGMPVNLATIPDVRTDTRMADGRLEGFIAAGVPSRQLHLPISEARELVCYLHSEPGYHIVQHGCHHDLFEFATSDRRLLAERLDLGARRLREADFVAPSAFVAPYDRLSRQAYLETAARFDVISTGWFEAARLPFGWWPAYFAKKIRGQPHWRAGPAALLSHPGCLLSYHRPYSDIVATVRRAVESAVLTVLVTHWWEYFRDRSADDPLIDVLHEVAEWLGRQRDIRVVSFGDIASGAVPLG